MFAFRNKQLYNEKSKTTSSTLTCTVHSLRMEPDYYLAIVNVILVDNTPAYIKIPINSFGAVVLNQIINSDPDTPITIESYNKVTQIYQNDRPITQAPIYLNQDQQHKYMIEAVNYFTK